MILLAAALLLAAVGLLATGIAQGSSALEWASFAASALAVLVLAAGELRRRRRRTGAAGAGPRPRPEPGSRPEPAADALAEAALNGPVPVVPADTGRPPRVPGPQTGRHWAPDPEPDVQPLSSSSVPPPVTRAPAPPGSEPVAAAVPTGPDGEPPAEEVEFTDLLMIMDLADEVLVVDEHPRYHLAGCPHLAGGAVVPLPMDQARIDGFTPCGTCAPDRTLAAHERARRSD